jgi:ABC-type Mn2+/Zn2+ transport system ATPase subunit
MWQAAIVRFDNVWLRYNGRSRWVLQAVDVAIAPGEIAVVVGRNGAGKTTLLAAAAGLLPPVRGRVVDRPTRIGWVPERFPANQPFTVGAYLIGMARAHGLSRASATEAVEAWCERLFLTRYLDAHLADVSKGTAQKVGLIQGLIPGPELLILDEPWEGLDSQTRDLIPDIVGEVLAAGGSVLVSDHLGEINRLPGALRWHVESGHVDHYEVTSEVASAAPARYVIEIGVAATQVPEVVAQLRELGHEALKVRAARAEDSLPPLSTPARASVPVETRGPNYSDGPPEPPRGEPSRLTVLHRGWDRRGSHEARTDRGQS